MPFFCSICGEESLRICARCTKDACNNHICEKCLKCSDCCECEVVLTNGHAAAPFGSARSAINAATGIPQEPARHPEPPQPPPDPDPIPDEEEPEPETP
jgi:hypothetical protein